MKTQPIRAARIEFDADGPPRAPDFDDIYHSRAGALGQAQHVFVRGNRLTERWRGRSHFTVLETGFGLGNNFLATWRAWRDDPQRCERLHYIGIDLHPPLRDDLQRAHQRNELPDLAQALTRDWPPLTSNLHTLPFDDARVQLLLGFFDVRDLLPELIAEVDAFFLDGFAPARNPAMWERHVMKALARLAAPGATASTWSVAREMQAGLREAGFIVEEAQGFRGKREMTVARYAPSFVPKRPPSRLQAAPRGEPVLIVGAGLAGCAAAWALKEQGIASRLIDRHAAPAQETSGNAAGLLHGIVTAQDGTHARFNRAAALMIERVAGSLGGSSGLLRLDDAAVDAMQAELAALGLPADYVQAVDSAAASRLSGLSLRQAAWFYPGGGWLQPAALAASYLSMAGATIGQREVHALRQREGGWELLDAEGRVIDSARTVVLANAADAMRLLGDPAWPTHRSRGQVSGLPAATPGLVAPRLPVAGAGYVLPPLNRRVWCGATSRIGDDDPSVRDADHHHNMMQLSQLLGTAIDIDPARLEGRTGWRFVADDRLPLLGAVPATIAGARVDQPRFVPRLPGLHVLTALGSRGITWSALAARTVASLIAGTPCPLEASLLDAVDVARWVTRAANRK